MSQPETYLRNVDALLRAPARGARGVWPRACAWLLRLALEAALDAHWRRVSSSVALCHNRRAQVLMLHRFAGPIVAAQVSYIWWALSRVGHHRGYELAPTAAELGHLRTAVMQALAAL
jgi:hypothetical protein